VENVDLNLGDNSYVISIGSGLMRDAKLISPSIKGRKVLIVTNETIAPIYLDVLKRTLCDFDLDSIVLLDGEEFKTLEVLNKIYDVLLESNHNRSSTIVALGGGVVGDMAGFAAASYQRGIDFIQIPTTLLSQVDSSVGGKTAVNHPLGKNMIGAFYQPKAVIIDLDSLISLSKRDFASGMAEVIKHAALADIQYFDWLEENLDQVMSLEPSALTTMIKWSCEIKAAIVAQDEKETGVRALLNFGHTFGHAIENGMGYGKWTHGEAVATGMVMAADLSVRIGLCTLDDGRRLKRLLQAVGLPVVAPESMKDKFVELMLRDKKTTDTGLRFVLLESLGSAKLIDNVSLDHLGLTLSASSELL